MERTWLQGGKTTNHQTLFPRESTTCLPKRRKWKTGIDINLIATARSQTQPNELLLCLSFVPSVVLHEFVFWCPDRATWLCEQNKKTQFISCMFCNVWAEQKTYFVSCTFCNVWVKPKKMIFSCMFCNVWAEQKTWFFSLHVLQSHTKFKPTASQERSKSSTSVHNIVTFPLLFRFNFLKPMSNQNQIFSRVFRQAKMILHWKWKKVILDRLQTPPHKLNKVSTQI